MKSPKMRWGPEDKQKAYALWRRRWVVRGGVFALGIILMWLYCTSFLEMQQRRADVQTICTIIKKYNPAFEPQWVKPTARYLVDNSGPFDPVWLAVVAGEEGCFKVGAESTIGAEGWFQNLPDKDKAKMDRLCLQYQTEQAIQKLLFFYKNGFPLNDKVIGKGTVFGMHGGYVGWRTNRGKPTAMGYMARIYCEYAQARGLPWKKKTPKDSLALEREGKATEVRP